MDNRKRIGLFFSYNENWIGGSYYILNLIEALKLLPDAQTPHLTVFCVYEKDIELVQRISYPYIKLVQWPVNLLLKKIVNVLYRKIRGINYYDFKEKFSRGYFDALFPVPNFFNVRIAKKCIYWIPDFQEIHLPYFFSSEELEIRKARNKKIAASGNTVLFSSYDAQKDFNNLYPAANTEQAVVQFAVTHPDYKTLSYEAMRGKYRLPSEYFFCPNQFWIHKNQQVILEAIALIKKEENKPVYIVFSGKNYDPRNVHYFDELKSFVRENDIEQQVQFLGFIDRKEQLLIMKHAQAVIQPSLCEGWSTVVEDAKAMDQNVIASNLGVHIEQLGEKAVYFDPKDSQSLKDVLVNYKKEPVFFDYNKNRQKFALDFIKIIHE